MIRVSEGFYLFWLSSREDYFDKAGKGGVMKLFSFFQFLFDKGFIIVLGGELDNGVVKEKALDNGFAWHRTSSRPSGYLGNELEGVLIGSKIGDIEAAIGS